MLDRARRFSIKDKSSLTFLGPTTYIIPEKTTKESWSPFGACGDRFPKIKNTENPSPAEYNPKFREHRIIGGTSMKQKAPRVCMVPAKYTLPSLLSYKAQEQKKVFPTHKVKSFLSKKVVAPKQEKTEEYEEVLQEFTMSLELPAYLTFPGEVSSVTRKYKGAVWSRYTAKRELNISKTGGPGPGDYFIEDPNAKPKEPKKPKIIQPKSQKPEDTKIYEDDKTCEPEDTICQPELYDSSCDYLYKCISFNKKGTFSQAPRFVYKINENPAPWDYDPIQFKCKRRGGTKAGGIYHKETSIPCKEKKSQGPGPGEYNVLNDTIQKRVCEKVHKYWGMKEVPFQSTSGRCLRVTKEDLEPTPGPADYSVVNATECRRKYYCVNTYSIMSSPFPRFPVKKPDCDQKTYYDVGTAFKNTVLKKSHHKGPQKPFDSTAPRNTVLFNMGELAHSSGFHHPRLDTDFQPSHGGVVSMQTRRYATKKKKVDHMSEINIHPKYLTCFYPTTHNVTLKPPPEKHRRGSCSKPLKKILNCFLPIEVTGL